ncbi:MAG: lipid A deacylase LpxR family protein [Kiloniellales bacterium]
MPLLVLLVFAVALLPAASLRAEDLPECDVIVSLQVENDRIAGTDRNYTHGTRLSLLSPEVNGGCGGEDWRRPTETLQSWASAIPFPDPYPNRRWNLAVGQSIFTPENTGAEDLIEDDRPYAAWLYVGFGVVAYDEAYENYEAVNLDLGVVGPLAQGEFVQNTFHNLIGVPEADGWDNQIENEPGFMLSYERKWRFRAPGEVLGMQIDMLPHVGGSLGNVMTHAGLGATFRIGAGLPSQDFGPPRIRPSVPGSDFFTREKKIGWYLFGGGEGRAVMRNIFLDGNTFRDSHSVDKNNFVFDLQGGAAVSYDRARLVFTTVLRSPEQEGDEELDLFGALTLGVRF